MDWEEEDELEVKICNHGPGNTHAMDLEVRRSTWSLHIVEREIQKRIRKNFTERTEQRRRIEAAIERNKSKLCSREFEARRMVESL